MDEDGRPPGWYLRQGEEGVERWWDGSAWTTASRPEPAEHRLAAQAAEMVDQPPVARRRPRITGAVALVVVGVVAGVIGAAGGQSGLAGGAPALGAPSSTASTGPAGPPVSGGGATPAAPPPGASTGPTVSGSPAAPSGTASASPTPTRAEDRDSGYSVPIPHGWHAEPAGRIDLRGPHGARVVSRGANGRSACATADSLTSLLASGIAAELTHRHSGRAPGFGRAVSCLVTAQAVPAHGAATASATTTVAVAAVVDPQYSRPGQPAYEVLEFTVQNAPGAPGLATFRAIVAGLRRG